MKMNRRAFLGTSVGMVATSVLGDGEKPGAGEKGESAKVAPPAAPVAVEIPFKFSAPVLQAPGETSMGIAWRVNKLAHGEVEVSASPDFKDPICYRSGTGLGLAQLDEEVLQVRLTGLFPATRYWYRTRTTPFVQYHNAYDFEVGPAATSPIYSFTTLGAAAKPHFAVMNDTHMRWDVFAKAIEKIQALKPAVTIWNGDATNTTETKRMAADAFITPPIGVPAWSAESPVLFTNGNHDFRGRFMSRLGEVVLERLPGERLPKFEPLSRCFALRLGEIALIGLDTGEDKPDAHPKWAGLANFSPLRQLEAEWLDQTLQRAEIAQAPFVVVFCHIPIYCPESSPLYAHDGVAIDPSDFARWSRECHDLWAPLLERHRVQVVVAAHQHRYNFYPAEPGRSWAEIVGGGCSIPAGDTAPEEFPTVIEGFVEGGQLKLVAHNLRTGAVESAYTFAPRQVR